MRVEQQKDGKGAKAPHNATLSLDGQGQRGWTAPWGEAVGDSPLACSTVCQIDSTGKRAPELGLRHLPVCSLRLHGWHWGLAAPAQRFWWSGVGTQLPGYTRPAQRSWCFALLFALALLVVDVLHR